VHKPDNLIPTQTPPGAEKGLFKDETHRVMIENVSDQRSDI